MLGQQELNRAMILVEDTASLMERLARLPTEPDSSLLLSRKTMFSSLSHQHHLLENDLNQMMLHRPVETASVTRALSYGINTESSAARFVNLCFVWGDRFEMKPGYEWALRITTDPALSGPEKIEELVSRTKVELNGRFANVRGSHGN
jgi:hypothetical protein